MKHIVVGAGGVGQGQEGDGEGGARGQEQEKMYKICAITTTQYYHTNPPLK